MKAREVIREGYHFRIGNDQSLFWYAPWTSFGPLCTHIFVVDIHDIALHIKDLFYNNHWHRENIPNSYIYMEWKLPIRKQKKNGMEILQALIQLKMATIGY